MIKCAIFDADGTLIDSLGLWRETDEEYISSKGLVFDEGSYKDINKLTYGESISFVKKVYGLTDSEEKISADILAIVRKKYANVKVNDGITGLLDKLYEKGVEMAVATANDKELIELALDGTGLKKYFSFVISCDEVGEGKNSALVFIRAAELLGFGPCETLVVEDDRSYIETAKDAGFYAVHVNDIGGIVIE